MDRLTNIDNSDSTCHPNSQQTPPVLREQQTSRNSSDPLDFSLQSLDHDDFEKSDPRTLNYLRSNLSASHQRPHLKRSRYIHQLVKTINRKLTRIQSIEVLCVTNTCQSDLKSFYWGWIDLPKVGDEFYGSTISIGGWLIGKTSQPSAIQFLVDQAVVFETPINIPRPDVSKANFLLHSNCGFSAHINTSGWDRTTKVLLRAVFPEGYTAIAGSILIQKYG